jgi:hypothetical protein
VNAWQAIQYVGSGLSLVAFVVAAALFAYRARLRHRAEIIRSAPEKDRLEAIAVTAQFFRVDTSSLSPKKQEEIILAQITSRSRRDLMLGIICVIVALLLASIALAAIFRPQEVSADAKKRVNFIVRPNNPGIFSLLINNQGRQPLNLTSGKLIVSGQPSQTFDMQIGAEVGGPITSFFPPSTQGAVSGILFTCFYGREGWAALYAMRYGPNPTLDQRQCKICVNARLPSGDDVEPCEYLPCNAIATPVVGQNCEPASPSSNAGACRMPDGIILPRISPSGCIARGGNWLTPTPINR